MIPKSSKFPLRTEFLVFQKSAKQVATNHLRILSKQGVSSKPRLAVIIPKKVSKYATTRNWLKRLVYDSIYPHIKDVKKDCVVIFKSLTLKKSQITKEQIIGELFQIFKTN